MKYRAFLIATALLISSCGSNIEKEEVYDYEIALNSHIEWKSIFEQDEDYYLVYFYSYYCRYCQELKQEILQYYLLEKEIIYFVDVTDLKDIYYTGGEEMIGVIDSEELKIKGTPTLIDIEWGAITDVCLGVNQIREKINGT